MDWGWTGLAGTATPDALQGLGGYAPWCTSYKVATSIATVWQTRYSREFISDIMMPKCSYS